MRIVFFLLMLCLISCGNQSFHHSEIPTPTESAKKSFPLASIYSDPIANQIKKAANLKSLFEFEQAIKLQTPQPLVLGQATDILHVDDHWFVLDNLTKQVFKFNHDGSYIQHFGGEGQGPGELTYPKCMRLCFDGLIGVGDPYQGSISLFTQDGKFVRKSHPSASDMSFMPRYAFSWDHPDELVLPAFSSQNPEAPQHAVLDATNREQTLRFGFGMRVEPVERALQKGVAIKAYTAFEKIGDRFWTGSPYHTWLSVYDNQGRLLTQLGKKAPRDPEVMLTPDHYQNLDTMSRPDRHLRQTILKKAANSKIARVGNLVLSQMGHYTDVYDIHGNPLAYNKSSGILRIAHTYQDRLVVSFHAGVDLQKIDHLPIREALQSHNYQFDDNPYLLVFKLKPLSTELSRLNPNP